MKNHSILKIIRVIVAILIIIPLTFLFIDFAGYDLSSVYWLTKIQVTPAIMGTIAGASAGLVLLSLFVITLIGGRIYCSVICPFGIMQDIIGRISNLFKRKKKKRMRYARPNNILRYSLLGLCVILFIFGSISLISWLDPYSNFGRVAQNIVRPIYIELNNLAVIIGDWFNSSRLYFVTPHVQGFALGFSLFILVVVAVMVFMRGRLFCNTLCPVGALLSLVSRYSMFKLDFDKEKCNKCGLCEFKCKSQCIDSKQQKLDFSRCVTCYNCINTCNKGAMNYKFAWKKKTQKSKQEATANNIEVELESNSRRRFFGTALATAAAVTLAYAQKQKVRNGKVNGYTKDSPIAPPGATSIEYLKSKCTACHLCVAQCPTQVIKPAFMEYGLGGVMMPRMDYVQSFCNYECTVCSDVCPNQALQPLTIEQKKLTQIGKVYFVRRLCVVITDGTYCGACSEHCPTKAVDMVPFRDGLRIPKINQDICIGCGGCEFICPVRPFRAIYVDGNSVHQQAEMFKEEEKKDIQIDDFGF